jgi:hypothetical protein
MPFSESLLPVTRLSAIAMKNPRRTTAVALDHRVWRDLTRLAMQGLVAGLIVSILLGLAVFVVA